jgi:hypothetical protein
MTAIDERRLDTDLLYRFEYLREFIDFRMGDIAAIHAAAPVLAPSCPAWSMPFTPSSSSTCQHCGIYCPANGGATATSPLTLDGITPGPPENLRPRGTLWAGTSPPS